MSIAYIDDFGGAEKKLGEAELALHTLQGIFEELGVQEAEKKVCPPSQVMTWLGIEFNTKEMTMSLPEKKLREVAECLAEWQGRKRANLKEIQSVFGLLQFVTSVAPTARLFTNRILEAIRDLGPDHYTTLSWGFRRDLKFFQDLIPHFKGIKVMDKSDIPAQHSLELDACLTGCGAICHPEFYGRMFPAESPSMLSLLQDISSRMQGMERKMEVLESGQTAGIAQPQVEDTAKGTHQVSTTEHATPETLRSDNAAMAEVAAKLAEWGIHDDDLDKPMAPEQIWCMRGRKSGTFTKGTDSIKCSIDWPHFHIRKGPSVSLWSSNTSHRRNLCWDTYGCSGHKTQSLTSSACWRFCRM